MDKELQTQLFSRLDALTAEFGKAGSAMWQIAVRQSIITGTQETLWALALFTLGTTLLVKRATFVEFCEDPDVNFIVVGFASCAYVGCLALLTDALAYFLNPSYRALINLLHIIKGGY